MLKSYGGWKVAYSILVSAQGPLVLDLALRVWGKGSLAARDIFPISASWPLGATHAALTMHEGDKIQRPHIQIPNMRNMCHVSTRVTTHVMMPFLNISGKKIILYLEEV